MLAAMEELKSLVATTLEKKGVLASIRAQLRAHVFKAIEEQENVSKLAGHLPASGGTTVGDANATNKRLLSITATPQSILLLDLIREWLEFYELDYTTSTLNAEARQPLTTVAKDRATLTHSLHLSGAQIPQDRPLLAEILAHAQAHITQTNAAQTTMPAALLSPQHSPVSGALHSPHSHLPPFTTPSTAKLGVRSSSPPVSSILVENLKDVPSRTPTGSPTKDMNMTTSPNGTTRTTGLPSYMRNAPAPIASAATTAAAATHATTTTSAADKHTDPDDAIHGPATAPTPVAATSRQQLTRPRSAEQDAAHATSAIPSAIAPVSSPTLTSSLAALPSLSSSPLTAASLSAPSHAALSSLDPPSPRSDGSSSPVSPGGTRAARKRRDRNLDMAAVHTSLHTHSPRTAAAIAAASGAMPEVPHIELSSDLDAEGSGDHDGLDESTNSVEADKRRLEEVNRMIESYESETGKANRKRIGGGVGGGAAKSTAASSAMSSRSQSRSNAISDAEVDPEEADSPRKHDQPQHDQEEEDESYGDDFVATDDAHATKAGQQGGVTQDAIEESIEVEEDLIEPEDGDVDASGAGHDLDASKQDDSLDGEYLHSGDTGSGSAPQKTRTSRAGRRRNALSPAHSHLASANESYENLDGSVSYEQSNQDDDQPHEQSTHRGLSEDQSVHEPLEKQYDYTEEVEPIVD